MKIAVLLFGHLRSFETCVDSLREHVLSRYDCDVFMHTWDERDVKTRTWHNQICEPVLFDKAAMGAVIEAKYAPKYYEITHQNLEGGDHVIQSTYFPDYKFSLTGMHFLMYSMNRANELRHQYEKEHDVHYDYVLVTRPDVYFHVDFKIEKVIEQALCFGLDLNKTRFFATDQANSHFTSATFLDCCSDVLFFAYPQVVDTFIRVNTDVDEEYCKAHSMGINSIFACREIEAGIIPVPIAFTKGNDWAFSSQRVEKSQVVKQKSRMRMFVIKALSYVLLPVAYLFKRYSGLNYYK